MIRDAEGRIARIEIVDAVRPFYTYAVEAASGGDLRSDPAELRVELRWPNGPGTHAIIRTSGVPVAFATALLRDSATGAPLDRSETEAPGPSRSVFDVIATPSPTTSIFALICASSVGVDEVCRSVILEATNGRHLPFLPPDTPAYRALPEARTALEEAWIGCGPLHGTSCVEDGIDLFGTDPSVLYQRWPGFEPPLARGADSELLQAVSWNWFVRHLWARQLEPGIGDASGCTFATPNGCTGLGIEPVRSQPRRVLADEPIDGPALRWDWELGTTFELAPITIEGDLDPAIARLATDALRGRIHVSGPFQGTEGEPDAAVQWLPEPSASLAGAVAAAVLAVEARTRRC